MFWEPLSNFIGQVIPHFPWPFVTLLLRTRARLLADDDEKDLLSLLWRNAHDMCSVAACLVAFEDCKEPEGYDLGTMIFSS